MTTKWSPENIVNYLYRVHYSRLSNIPKEDIMQSLWLYMVQLQQRPDFNELGICYIGQTIRGYMNHFLKYKVFKNSEFEVDGYIVEDLTEFSCDFQQYLDKRDINRIIELHWNTLQGKEQRALDSLYLKGLTKVQHAEQEGVSPQRIHQIHSRLMRKLRQ